MKISVEKNSLENAISVAQKAVSSKSSIPALEGLLLTAESGQLIVSGYDLELGIECTIPCEVEEPGAIVLSARTFSDIVRKLPDGAVSIQADTKFMTTIQCGMTEFNLIGISASDFAEIPKVTGDVSFVLPQNLLKNIIRQTVYAVSQNENKPVHMGCLFEVRDGVLRVVGVDGYRLAMRTEHLECELPEMQFVVPGKTLSEIARILSDTDLPVTISVTKKQILFQTENIVLVSRLLEGEFLNYNNAIPKEGSVFLTVDVKSFIESVERTGLMISERLKSPLRILFDSGKVKLSCATALGTARDEFEAEMEGDSIEIGFNNKFVLDALKNCEEEKVKLQLASPLLPMVITPVEGDKFLFLVLPVRLKSEN